MKTSEEFVREIKEKNGEQMTRDGKLIREMDDKELLKRVLERYPGERDNIVDLDTFLGENELTENPIEKTDMEKKFDEVKKSPGFLARLAQAPKKIIADVGSDIVETAKGIGGELMQGARDIKDIATDNDFNLAQKFAGVAGEIAGTGANVIGEGIQGIAKVGLTPEAETNLKDKLTEIGQDISENEKVQKVAEWYNSLEKDDKLVVDSLGGVLSFAGEFLGLGAAKRVAKPVVETALDVSQKTADALQTVPAKLDEVLEPRRQAKIEENKKLADEAIKRIVQPTGKTTQEIASEVAAAKRTLSDVETAGDYMELRSNLADKTKAVSQSQDEYLSQFPEKYKNDQLGTYAKVGDETVVTNSVVDALDGLESAYKQSGEAVAATKIKQLREKLNSEGLTVSDLNQLAREYNIEFKSRAFDKMGNPKQGYNAENYENVRKGVKQTLRDRLPDETSKAIDAEISDLYETNRMIDRMAVQVEKAVAAAPKESMLKKAVSGVVGTVDMLTGNIVSNIIRSIGSRAGIKQTKLSAFELQQELQKNLDEFQKLSTDPKKLSEKLEQYVDEDLSPGLGIRSTVRPDKVAKNMDKEDFNRVVRLIDDPVLRIDDSYAKMLDGMGLKNATDDELTSFLKEVVKEYEGEAEMIVN